jgi:polysaccharide biosynthesis transport protein
MSTLYAGRSGQDSVPAKLHREQSLSLSDAIAIDVRDNLLVDKWKLLRRNFKLLLGLAALGGLIGLGLSLLQRPAYEANALLEIQEVNEDFLNLKSITPIAQESGAVSIDEIQTYIRRLQSRSLLAPVVEKLGMVRPAPKPGLLSRLLHPFASKKSVDPLESSIDAAAGHLNIREIGRSRMVEIAYSSDSPDKAAQFANALAEELLAQNLQTRGMLTRNVSEWINSQLDGSRLNLEKSERALEDYTRRAGLLYLGNSSTATGTEIPNTSISTERLRQVQEELSRAQADRMSKESLNNLAQGAPADTLPFLAGDAALRTQQDKLTDLKRQKAELGTNYTPRYATMKSLDAQITLLQASLASERAIILRQIENDYKAALGREDLLLRQYTQQSKLVNQEGVKAVEYQMLKREVESNRQIYDDMLQRTKQAGVAAALRANNIRVVDAARVPTSPYSPNPPVNTVLGSIGGFLLAAAWVTAFSGEGKIRAPGELKSMAGVSELGVIQSIKSLSKGQTVLTEAIASDKSASTNTLPSLLGHAYGSILTSLTMGETSKECRVIAITSPGAMEGKTSVVSGLAIALARMQQKVLVIDGDLYKPGIHERFHIKNDTGLADLLQSQDTSRRKLLDCIQTTVIPNLSILSSGSSIPTPLLFSGRLKEIVRELRDEYNFVLIDTPPLLQIADARILGKLSDSVVLVIRSGQTTREAALLSLERLQEDGISVLGTVLNDWTPSAAELKSYASYERQASTPRSADLSLKI